MDPEKRLPGLTRDEFQAAVEALVELQKAGKYFVFYSRRSALRLIGESGEFREAFASKLPGGTVDEELSKRAIRELRNFLNASLGDRAVDRIVNFLRDAVFEDEIEQMDQEARDRFTALLRAKTELVTDRLLESAQRERFRRIRSSISPSFEDLDVEVISHRRDQLSDEDIDTPFLRLRFRYSEVTGDGVLGVPTWGAIHEFTGTPGFEIECDERDIDLMLVRLREAKQRLAQAVQFQIDKK
ncbi:MAG: hypothetical protein V2A79_04660 [Planctomycetota bacterium]